jgi:hypothetical protein
MPFSVLNTIDVGKWVTIYLHLGDLCPGSTSFFLEDGGILQEDCLDGGLNVLTFEHVLAAVAFFHVLRTGRYSFIPW